MNIQWFPGHMTKALRLIEENIKLVDAVIYVLDARACFSCINPKFKEIIKNKPCLMLLNKADLADQKATKEWLKYFQKGGFSLSTNAAMNNLKRPITDSLKLMLKDKIEASLKRGITKTLRAMVIGVPNSGKSTVINSIAKEKLAVTGDKPGVTKGKQWLRLDNSIELLDTPGTLWNAFADQKTARHLAYIGSIKDDILDIQELALNLIIELKEIYPEELKNRYSIENLNKPEIEILNDICLKRGCVIAKGGFDYERGAKALIDDFRKGKLGRISLEKAADYV